MSKSENPTEKPSAVGGDFMIITVTELDRLVYKALLKQSAAKPSKSGETDYVITDREKAKSQNILPKVLNVYGKKGWRLTAVNNMECYIFERDMNKVPLEYMVCTPPDLDRLAMKNLEKNGHLKMTGFEGEVPTVEITSPEDAKIQNVLPKILQKICEGGWKLSAISGPQLYFFTRSI